MQLLAEYMRKEVEDAIFSSKTTKSPRPDNYTSGFLRDSWNTVGEEVTDAILEFKKNDEVLGKLNATVITSIPKIAKPQNASEFRPISCHNVIYKGITNLLNARLRKVLLELVNETQAAFIKGRSLVHNVLICHALMRHY